MFSSRFDRNFFRIKAVQQASQGIITQVLLVFIEPFYHLSLNIESFYKSSNGTTVASFDHIETKMEDLLDHS